MCCSCAEFFQCSSDSLLQFIVVRDYKRPVRTRSNTALQDHGQTLVAVLKLHELVTLGGIHECMFHVDVHYMVPGEIYALLFMIATQISHDLAF